MRKRIRLPLLSFGGSKDELPADSALRRLFWVTGHDRIINRDARIVWADIRQYPQLVATGSFLGKSARVSKRERYAYSHLTPGPIV